jgi:hypothetical protein
LAYLPSGRRKPGKFEPTLSASLTLDYIRTHAQVLPSI